MSLPDASSPGDDWMDARVEAYVDDALPPPERTAFEKRLADAPRWQQSVRRARRLRRSLRTLPQSESCPPAVTQSVLQRTVRSTTRSDRPPAPRARRRPPPTAHRARAWQATLVSLLLLMGAAIAALVAQSPPPAETAAPVYTRAEVKQAAAEAEWALALVAEVTRETGQTVREDVLEARVGAHVTDPVRRALASPALDRLPPAPEETSSHHRP